MKRPAASAKGKALVQKARNVATNLKKTQPKKAAAQEKKWADLSLDEFINSSASDDNEDNSEEEEGEEESGEDNANGSELDSSLEEEEEAEDEELNEDEGDSLDGEEADGEEEEDSDGSDSEREEKSTVKDHKKTLSKLQETDPEFYQFLSENDRALLEFDTSDSEDEERGGEVHHPPNPEDLEVGSDDSDFEDKESTVKRAANVITQSMVDKWQQELKDPK